jgi:hypothetical protein
LALTLKLCKRLQRWKRCYAQIDTFLARLHFHMKIHLNFFSRLPRTSSPIGPKFLTERYLTSLDITFFFSSVEQPLMGYPLNNPFSCTVTIFSLQARHVQGCIPPLLTNLYDYALFCQGLENCLLIPHWKLAPDRRQVRESSGFHLYFSPSLQQ